MTLTGKLYKNSYVIRMHTVTNNDESLNMTVQLEDCLLNLCKHFNIPLPIWMKKNTKEFAQFKKTFFTEEQFVEHVTFDRFVIEMEH